MFHADVAAPITAAFLVDVSGSMSLGNKMTLAQHVFEQPSRRCSAGEDEAALFTFDTRVDERQPFTRDFRQLASVLPKIEPFGATSLYDMVAHTTKRIQATPSAHAALVVVTDGFDTSSTLTPGEVSAIASAAQVPIYVVATTAHRPTKGGQGRRRSRRAVPRRSTRSRGVEWWRCVRGQFPVGGASGCRRARTRPSASVCARHRCRGHRRMATLRRTGAKEGRSRPGAKWLLRQGAPVVAASIDGDRLRTTIANLARRELQDSSPARPRSRSPGRSRRRGWRRTAPTTWRDRAPGASAERAASSRRAFPTARCRRATRRR